MVAGIQIVQRCTDEVYELMLKANSLLEFLSTVIWKLRLNT